MRILVVIKGYVLGWVTNNHLEARLYTWWMITSIDFGVELSYAVGITGSVKVKQCGAGRIRVYLTPEGAIALRLCLGDQTQYN